MKFLGHSTTALIEWHLPILVDDGHQGASLHQILCNLWVAPEAGVVQWSVAVLIDEVDVCPVTQQLGGDEKGEC